LQSHKKTAAKSSGSRPPSTIFASTHPLPALEA
jgi:hypothetical protein